MNLTRTRVLGLSVIIVTAISCVVLALSLGIVPAMTEEGTIGTIPGEAGLWHRSSVYDRHNESFSVVIRFVTFTFLYADYIPGLLDVPTVVCFSVRFEDGNTEMLNATIGGGVLVEPRVILSAHTQPVAAIVSAFDTDHWYDWYYAVSI